MTAAEKFARYKRCGIEYKEDGGTITVQTVYDSTGSLAGVEKK